MDGYVISMQRDGEVQIKYWSGNAATESLDDATFISEIASARRNAATLQNQFTDHDVVIVPAFKGIQLKNVVSTSIR